MRAKSLAGKPAIGVEAMNTDSSRKVEAAMLDAMGTISRPGNGKSIDSTSGTNNRTKDGKAVDSLIKTEVCRSLRARYEATRPESWDHMTPTDKAAWEESHSYESYLENYIQHTADGKDARAQYEATRPESWDQMTPTDKAAWEESHPYTEWLENTIASAASTPQHDENMHDEMESGENENNVNGTDHSFGYTDTDTEAEAGTTETETETDSTSSEHENGKSPATKPPGMPESDWIKSQSHNETSYDGKTLLSKLEHAANEASRNAFDRESALAEILPPETPDEGAGIEKD